MTFGEHLRRRATRGGVEAADRRRRFNAARRRGRRASCPGRLRSAARAADAPPAIRRVMHDAEPGTEPTTYQSAASVVAPSLASRRSISSRWSKCLQRLDPETGRVTAAHVRAMPAGWRGAAGGHRPRVERAWCAVPVAGRSGTQPQPLGWDVVGTNGGGDAGLSALYRSGVWNRRQTTDRTGRSTVVGGCVVSTAVTHPALVSEADFVAAQRVKADSTSSATPVGSTPESRRIASFSACSCRAGWGRGRLPRARTIGGRARRAGRAPVATG